MCWEMGPDPINLAGMWRTVLIYGAALALGALGLQWLEYRMFVRSHPTGWYPGLLALAFMLLGAWASHRLRRRRADTPFEINRAALSSLGVSEREMEVLELVADGKSNKEIAQRLSVSPNTVKTHLANVFGKLGARRRTEAICRARELGILR
jgi:DNA-binding CsgD family transcriptional regulator